MRNRVPIVKKKTWFLRCAFFSFLVQALFVAPYFTRPAYAKVGSMESSPPVPCRGGECKWFDYYPVCDFLDPDCYEKEGASTTSTDPAATVKTTPPPPPAPVSPATTTTTTGGPGTGGTTPGGTTTGGTVGGPGGGAVGGVGGGAVGGVGGGAVGGVGGVDGGAVGDGGMGVGDGGAVGDGGMGVDGGDDGGAVGDGGMGVGDGGPGGGPGGDDGWGGPCGNTELDPGEQCDASAPNGNTCADDEVCNFCECEKEEPQPPAGGGGGICDDPTMVQCPKCKDVKGDSICEKKFNKCWECASRPHLKGGVAPFSQIGTKYCLPEHLLCEVEFYCSLSAAKTEQAKKECEEGKGPNWKFIAPLGGIASGCECVCDDSKRYECEENKGTWDSSSCECTPAPKCGDKKINGSEQCDPTADPTGCGDSETCSSDCYCSPTTDCPDPGQPGKTTKRWSDKESISKACDPTQVPVTSQLVSDDDTCWKDTGKVCGKKGEEGTLWVANFQFFADGSDPDCSTCYISGPAGTAEAPSGYGSERLVSCTATEAEVCV